MEVKVGLTGNEIEELFIEIRGLRKGKKIVRLEIEAL